MSILFEPVSIGGLDLPNRVVMAPMTRCRADQDGVPLPFVAEHYRQRADAGLIISEATAVCRLGAGYPCMPGVYTDDQQAAWAPVIDAVHEAGGRFVMQLIHTGRIGHSSVIGGNPVAPSALTPGERVMAADFSMQPFEAPTELDEAGIRAAIETYASAAARAVAAGADGVEIHGANGYLIDQFLRTGANAREDGWGATPAGRARFLLEVTNAVTKAVGPEATVGVRLSPWNPFNTMDDRNPGVTFRHASEALAATAIHYLHVTEMGAPPAVRLPQQLTRDMARVFGRDVIVNGAYDAAKAGQVLEDPGARISAVAFGTPYIANPDLVRRMKEKLPLAKADEATFYAGGEKGYTDYPVA